MTFNFTIRYAGQLPLVVIVYGALNARQARQELRNAYATAFATISSLVTPERHTTEHLHIQEVA